VKQAMEQQLMTAEHKADEDRVRIKRLFLFIYLFITIIIFFLVFFFFFKEQQFHFYYDLKKRQEEDKKKADQKAADAQKVKTLIVN
jgi:flagellar basal body-associated protein FliL